MFLKKKFYEGRISELNIFILETASNTDCIQISSSFVGFFIFQTKKILYNILTEIHIESLLLINETNNELTIRMSHLCMYVDDNENNAKKIKFK